MDEMCELKSKIEAAIIEAADSRMHSADIARMACPNILSLLTQPEGEGDDAIMDGEEFCPHCHSPRDMQFPNMFTCGTRWWFNHIERPRLGDRMWMRDVLCTMKQKEREDQSARIASLEQENASKDAELAQLRKRWNQLDDWLLEEFHSPYMPGDVTLGFNKAKEAVRDKFDELSAPAPPAAEEKPPERPALLLAKNRLRVDAVGPEWFMWHAGFKQWAGIDSRVNSDTLYAVDRQLSDPAALAIYDEAGGGGMSEVAPPQGGEEGSA